MEATRSFDDGSILFSPSGMDYVDSPLPKTMVLPKGTAVSAITSTNFTGWVIFTASGPVPAAFRAPEFFAFA
ncbi:MAG: hypothetical protein WCS90_01795 [Bacilli bacterium]